MPAAPALSLKRLSGDDRGGVAIMFGLSAMVITMLAGIAVDYSRINHERSRMFASIDAAALAAGKAMLDGRMGDDEVRAMALAYFEKNLEGSGPGFGKLQNFSVDLDRSTNGVTIKADVEVPMTLTRVAGFERVVFPVSASTLFEQNDIELSLALDVTGSMQPIGKLDALQDASKDLFEILLPDGGTPNKVRIALAPYASGVNVGSYDLSIAGKTAPGGCVFERQDGDNASERPPVDGTYFKVRGDAGVSATAPCPTARIVPLTSDRGLLEREVEAYRADYSTAGHLGAIWAANMLSPDWGPIFGGDSAPAPYRDGKTIKAMLLMTDGLFNTMGGVNRGDDSPTATQSQRIAVDVCERARNENVIVFAIGFKLDEIGNPGRRRRAEQTLRDCAGASTRYFEATARDELRSAFQAIAVQLNKLRLTN
ncbi:MAG: pilus assembly protein TadG-related protein [Hyphomicrobiaceae bacterium]